MALVFFDLDGTLTRLDTFIPYCLIALLHRPKRILAIKHVLIGLIRSVRGQITQHKLKEAFILTFLKGLGEREIRQINKVFLCLFIPSIVRKESLKKLRKHQLNGDQVFIVTASPDIYVQELSRQWQLNGTICTNLQWKKGRLTGSILGRNCRGEEKERRIRALFDKRDLDGSYAYGNSDGDRQMLELVSFGTKI